MPASAIQITDVPPNPPVPLPPFVVGGHRPRAADPPPVQVSHVRSGKRIRVSASVTGDAAVHVIVIRKTKGAANWEAHARQVVRGPGSPGRVQLDFYVHRADQPYVII